MKKLLVANRGEIAVRIFRTCKRLGVETVAVAAPDDREALHARVADDGRGRSPSYLDAGEHVRAAQESGADAVHPGYGFLAESPELAEAVEDAGLTFVGPTPEALRQGGDKLAAKEIARQAGVPVVPHGEPEDVGFPLVVKAAAGGGGRGMRVVRAPPTSSRRRWPRRAGRPAPRSATTASSASATSSARVTSRSSCSETAPAPCVSLGERECSIQRRHQKVLEESPSVAIDEELRQAMSDAAVAFARAIDYRSAGTAEFMLDGRDFYFLELNGRIQVEHPVTELVTGVDLVEQQIRIADGETLVATFVTTASGHAVEVRLYAEDPRTFLPQTGRITRLRLPAGIRVDAGVEEGDEVGLSYDPMIAKLVAHAATRHEALERLAAALRETEVEGVTTNLPFLRWLVAHPHVRAGRTTTSFLVENTPLSPHPASAPAPWHGAWRLNGAAPPPAAPPDVDAAAHEHGTVATESTLSAQMPGTVLRVLVSEGDTVAAHQPLLVLEAMKMETPVTSPHEATVRRLLVAEGDQVAAGQKLVELED